MWNQWLFALVCLLCSKALALSEPREKPQFPEPLNEEEFNTQLKSGLHVVEFYSPNCGHCKSLAPTWKRTWETFYDEGQALNITFSQVNCLLSGDLCAKEKIAYFPTLRLYGPSGVIKNFPDNAKRSMENLIDFARREASDPANAEAVDIKSTSVSISGDKFNHLLAGKGEQPILVSFWPSKTMRSTDEDIEFENCEDCLPFQRTWRLLSSRLLSSNISTGHVNCESSQKLCEELGFDDLVKIKNYSVERLPRVALIVPGRNVNNLFIYESGFSTSVSDYEDFAIRVNLNCEAPQISAAEVKDIVEQDFQLPSSSVFASQPQKLHLVFAYNPETVAPEDFAVLEHLVEPLSNIPNAYLYKSTDDMKQASRSALLSMYQMINYKSSEPEKTIKEEFLDLNVMDENPTFYVFKDGDRVPHLFPGYSTTELRSLDRIVSWVESLSLPLINEVTPSNFKELLNFETDEYSGLAIQLVDTSNSANFEKSSRHLQELTIGAYNYEDFRMQHVINATKVERSKKAKKVKELKEKGASAKKRVRAAIQGVPHVDDNKVILGYVDLSKSSGALREMGLTYRGDSYNPGDVVIINKASKFVYEHDVDGGILTSDASKKIKDALVSALLPKSTPTPPRITGHLLNTPFGDPFRLLDFLHQYGFLGYVGLLSVILISYKLLRFYSKSKTSRKYKAKRNTYGILGNTNQKKFSD